MAQTATVTAPPRKSWVGRHRTALLIGGPLLVAVVALTLYLLGGRYVSTDDAYVEAGRVDVSANISGRVISIAVHDNALVRKGDVLFTFDERPWRIKEEAAEARLAAARLQVAGLKATYLQRKADEKAAADTLLYEQKELKRQQSLAAEGISSARQLDEQRHALDAAQQGLTAAKQQTAQAFADLGGEPDAPIDSHPQVQEAKAALDDAQLNLSYTTVKAPIDGVVSKVEQLQVGDYVNAAQPLFALVSQNNMWVEANFKETDLTYMRPGQEASFVVDAFPGAEFKGKVESTSPGTGSSFSLLPPENSSGNWVKVVQRVPVRISIEGEHADLPLAAGMSVNVEVDTEHHRSLLFWKDQ